MRGRSKHDVVFGWTPDFEPPLSVGTLLIEGMHEDPKHSTGGEDMMHSNSEACIQQFILSDSVKHSARASVPLTEVV